VTTDLTQRFVAFFEAVNEGNSPYPWQIGLMEEIARTGRWPEEITAPTGAGKSSVVDIHAFLVAERARQLASGQEPTIARPPRRLVLVAPRRVLVDDQYERATKLAAALSDKDIDGIVGETAHALRGLVTSAEERLESETPLGVAKLRGGIALDLSWRIDPARCQIICATPQMWGSRLLLRGYRGSRRARALETGLLTNDVAVIIDEAHLHRRLVDTARRIASWQPDELGLQVTAMSATIGGGRTLGPEDYADPSLARRVDAVKRVKRIPVEAWSDGKVTSALAEEALALRQGMQQQGTVGVFANTVGRALAVAEKLQATGGAVVVVCGQMRPADIERIRFRYEGLLDARGNPEVDYLVSTQSLEVGADLDLPAMVTELAPPSALAQRAGRLNRSGSQADSTFVVVEPAPSELDPESKQPGKFAPYSARELFAGSSWLDSLGGSISPRRGMESEMPRPEPAAVPTLAQTDLEILAITGSNQSADIDVDLYVEEPRDDPDRQVFVCAREHLHLGDASLAALKASPPTARELAPFRLGKALKELLKAAGDGPVAILRTEKGELNAFWLPGNGESAVNNDLRDGDVVVIPAGLKVMTAGVIHPPGSSKPTPRDPIDDVSGEPDEDGARTFVLVLPGKGIAASLTEDARLATRSSREALRSTLAELGHKEASQVLRRPLRDVDVVWLEPEPDSDLDAHGLLVIREMGAGRLPTTAPENLVTIADHQRSVEERLEAIYEALDPRDLGVERDQLLLAARHHDAGKAHPLFQARMGADEGDEPLAKPKPGHSPDRGDGWRHEQLSAAFAADASGFDPVVTTLTAAHHGHGQPLFDRDAGALLGNWDACPPNVRTAAERLFGPAGEYEEMRERLLRRLGVHRLAYLEALLRCADMQVSREGG